MRCSPRPSRCPRRLPIWCAFVTRVERLVDLPTLRHRTRLLFELSRRGERWVRGEPSTGDEVPMRPATDLMTDFATAEPGQRGRSRPSGEIRWFIRGAPPIHLRPVGPSERRTDAHLLDSLSPVSSVKLRGQRRRVLERKSRIRVALFRMPPLVGHVERWDKRKSRRRASGVLSMPIRQAGSHHDPGSDLTPKLAQKHGAAASPSET